MNIPFPEIWERATTWVEKQSRLVCEQGSPLLPAGIELARRVGVAHPERIRICIVQAIQPPDDVRLAEVVRHYGMIAENSAGLTLQYGIYIRDDQTHRPELWAHEYRHVAQYECIGSIRDFLFVYLRELEHFKKYGLGPLEVDAKEAEKNA